MRTALAIYCLILFAPGLSHGQTFGLGGLAESRPVRSQVFGLGEATLKPRLQVQPAATYKQSSLVESKPVVIAQPIAQPQTVCIDGRCYPATQSRQVFQRQPLFRRWR